MWIIQTLIVVLLFPQILHAAEPAREKIGTVLGVPVYRDQIKAKAGKPLHSELHNVFTRPVLKKYYQAHKADFDPTQEEVDQFVGFFQQKHQQEIKGRRASIEKEMLGIENKLKDKNLSDKKRKSLQSELDDLKMDLKGPDARFAMFVLPHWKMHTHFYKNYGGGRLLWQQRGMEAFDAMHQWLVQHEKKGEFTISDKKLRTAFYEYWTENDNSSFLISDKKRIEDEFLNPEWRSYKIVK